MIGYKDAVRRLFLVGSTYLATIPDISVATNQNKGAKYNGTIIRKRRPPNDLNWKKQEEGNVSLGHVVAISYLPLAI